ncbi:hypothetical protein RI054_11g58830 [Pseudoscourfieldia marina]
MNRYAFERSALLGGVSPDHAGLSGRIHAAWMRDLRGAPSPTASVDFGLASSKKTKVKTASKRAPLTPSASSPSVMAKPAWNATPKKKEEKAWKPLPGDETWRDELRASLGEHEAAVLAARLATPTSTQKTRRITPTSTAKAPRYDAYARGSSVTSAGTPAAVGRPVPAQSASPAPGAAFAKTYASAARSGALGEGSDAAVGRSKSFRKDERSNAGLQHVRRSRGEKDASVRRAIDAAVVTQAGKLGSKPITRPSEGPPTNRGTPLRQPSTTASSLRREASDLAASARLSPKPSASFVSTPGTGRDRPPRPSSAQGRLMSPYVMRRRDAEEMAAAEAAGAESPSPAPKMRRQLASSTPTSSVRRVRPASSNSSPSHVASPKVMVGGSSPASPAIVGARVARELEHLSKFVMVEISALRNAVEDVSIRLGKLEAARSSQRS